MSERLADRFGILSSHRVTFVGRNGSGKTVLAKLLSREFNSVCAVDFKHTLQMDGVEITSDPEKLKGLGIEYRAIIFRPPWEWEQKEINELFKWGMMRGRTLFYIDEGYSVGDAGSYPKFLKIIAVQGRETHVALWSLFQRPYGVPRFLVSEAEHLFVYFLNDPQDRARVEEVAQMKLDWDAINPERGGRFCFYHVKVGTERPGGPYRLKGIQ